MHELRDFLKWEDPLFLYYGYRECWAKEVRR